jgi:mono/diheme cytochrome c family protein
MTDSTDRSARPADSGLLDLEPDVERLHRQVVREPGDPEEGLERVPWWLWTIAVLSLFWGGWYLGRTGGPFDRTTHVAYAARGGAGGTDAAVANAVDTKAQTAVANPIERGRQLFTQNCQACHQQNGRGMPGVFPPVVGSEWVTGPEETVVRILLDGLTGPVQVAGVTFNGTMPTWRDPLNDDDLAAVATYIRQWAPNAARPVPRATVAALRGATASRGKPWTAEELRAAERAGPAGAPPRDDASPDTAAPRRAP